MPHQPDPDLRLRILERVHRLPAAHLALLDSYIDLLAGLSDLTASSIAAPQATTIPNSNSSVSQTRVWPHAPLHRINEHGTFFVTAATYEKKHLFRSSARLTKLEDELLTQAAQHGWQLEAWAVFSNHYHFLGHTLPGASDLKTFIKTLHAKTAVDVNQHDQEPGRAVWFNYWDTQLTFETSYFARLNYVHQNAVHHGLVRVANQYPWCSAAWFERTATPAQIATIYSFKTDKVNVKDEFVPELPV